MIIQTSQRRAKITFFTLAASALVCVGYLSPQAHSQSSGARMRLVTQVQKNDALSSSSKVTDRVRNGCASLEDISSLNSWKSDCQEVSIAYGRASVHFIIGTHDRPLQLNETLESLHTFVTDGTLRARVTVLQSSSDAVIQAAYNLVRDHNPKHKFLLKNDTNYFSTLKHVVRTSNATNFVIMSDDITFFRETKILKFATLQNVLSAYFHDVRFTVQLRISSRDNRPELIGEALPTDFLPHAQITDCSRKLHRSKPGSAFFFPVCYDRNIDGFMMTKSVLETELAQLDRFNPPNPGLLEAVWIETSYNYTGLDYAIFPIDRTVANTGMNLASVRVDRQRAETIELEKADRVDIAQKLIQGCSLVPVAPGFWLNLDAIQVNNTAREWRCPAT